MSDSQKWAVLLLSSTTVAAALSACTGNASSSGGVDADAELDTASDGSDTADAGDDTVPPDVDDTSPDAEDDGGGLASCNPATLTASTTDVIQATIELSQPCALTVTGSEAFVLEVDANGAEVMVNGNARDNYSRTTGASTYNVALNAATQAVVEVATIPQPAAIVRERSLFWTQPSLVDSPALNLHAVVSALDDGATTPGELVSLWFARFSTTAHSERVGPQLLLEEMAETLGDDPTSWNLADLPFLTTGVHNRIDLATGETCGELRVSFASTHPIFQPLHLIFLFAQPPIEGDRRQDGTLHCRETARRWSELSVMAEGEFAIAAEEIRQRVFTPDNFLLAETVEFTVSPWEWRQWTIDTTTDPPRFENPPLFQTVDIEGLNQPGLRRNDFLAWVANNRSDILNRRAELPMEFRAQSAQVNAGVPWRPLDLTGTPGVSEPELPELRRQLEIVGCPACHATDAEFVQTLPTREVSPFYDAELDARAVYLRSLVLGTDEPTPFGPLQPDPLLPP